MVPGEAHLRILLIDNYDSYTYNLFQGLAEVCGESPHVIRNDEVPWEELRAQLDAGAYHAVVVSPGPGTPARPTDVGLGLQLLLANLAIPVLGVCLGMQALALAFGGRIQSAACGPMHGMLSGVSHSGHALFEGIPSGEEWQVVRYHSLEVPQDSLPACLEPLAWAGASLMALRHRDLPYYGVQFHPESVATSWGPALLANFVALACKFHAMPTPDVPRAVPLRGPPGAVPVPRPYPPPHSPHGDPGVDLVHAGLPRGLAAAGPDGGLRIFETLFQHTQHAWWLDSAHLHRGARWSFMGGGVGGPLWRHVAYRGAGVLEEVRRRPSPCPAAADPRRLRLPGTFWDWLESSLADRRVSVAAAAAAAQELPFDFWGGWVGYLGYELRGELGDRPEVAPGTGLAPPHASLIWADRLLALDHETGGVTAVAMVVPGEPSQTACAQSWVDSTLAAVAQLAIAGAEHTPAPPLPPPSARDGLAGFVPREGHNAYLHNIEACLKAMHEGESYELCLTTQLERAEAPPAWPLYKTLRALNPASHAAWLDFSASGGPQICCSSPERFLLGRRDGVLEARPIKGTAPRYPADPAADAASAAELQASEKERAENLMIVDLLRNDLGRVCLPGSVHVPHLMALESLATVHQLVSTVTGLRREDASVVDCLRASFPGGSMTGAPKLRSMDILGQLEGGPRGIYSGSIGYLSANNTFDLNIVIRTAVVGAHGGISIGAGGAVTVQSLPEAEWQEVLLKARALLRAVRCVDAQEPT